MKKLLYRIGKTIFICLLLGEITITPFNSLSFSSVKATDVKVETINEKTMLSDGQFVYGPNVNDFDLYKYLKEKAPHLLPYYNNLYYYSLSPSINPRVILTLLELRNSIISSTTDIEERLKDPLRIDNSGFEKELDLVTTKLNGFFYYILNKYYKTSLEKREDLKLNLNDGNTILLSKNINAGTYALLATFSDLMGKEELEIFNSNLDNKSFYNTYISLFPESDPFSQQNMLDTVTPPSADLLQFPYPIGESWYYNGVHSYSIGGSDRSSIDFSTSSTFPSWGTSTSNSWAVAAFPGTITKHTNEQGVSCGATIDYGDGWQVYYYHLQNIQDYTNNKIKRNEKVGNLADSEAKATCLGGAASGEHVHFSLKKNGALYDVDGSNLSLWTVHSGVNSYETDCTLMYLHRTLRGEEEKKCPIGGTSPNSVNNDGPFGGDNPNTNGTVFWGDNVKDRVGLAEVKNTITIEDTTVDNSKSFIINGNVNKKNELTLKAGSTIYLKNGFKAEEGSKFNASIDVT